MHMHIRRICACTFSTRNTYSHSALPRHTDTHSPRPEAEPDQSALAARRATVCLSCTIKVKRHCCKETPYG